MTCKRKLNLLRSLNDFEPASFGAENAASAGVDDDPSPHVPM